MFHTATIPTDTLAAHTSAGLRFYAPRSFRGCKAAVKAGKAALAWAVLTSTSSDVTPEERYDAARTLVSLSVRFAVRLPGGALNLYSHEGIVGSDDNALANLCDTNSTWRPVYGGTSRDVFQLDKRTKRVETWSYTGVMGGVKLAVVTIDEQRV